MERRRRELVQRSYEQLAPGLNGLVETFYALLFERAPEVGRLFPADTTKLRAHFASALAILARNAANIEVMDESLQQMGARHATYGVRPEHYEVVQAILLEVLGRAAGPLWTPALHDAWGSLIAHVSRAMLHGAARAAMEAADRLTRSPHPPRVSGSQGGAP